MSLEWKLRKVMAEKNVWSGAELGRLLQDLAGYKLSAPSISALINEQPKQMKAETMDALCMASSLIIYYQVEAVLLPI